MCRHWVTVAEGNVQGRQPQTRAVFIIHTRDAKSKAGPGDRRARGKRVAPAAGAECARV